MREFQAAAKLEPDDPAVAESLKHGGMGVPASSTAPAADTENEPAAAN